MWIVLAILILSAAFYLAVAAPESMRAIRNFRNHVLPAATVSHDAYFVEVVETLTASGKPAFESARYVYAQSSTGAYMNERRQVMGLRYHEIRLRTPDRLAVVSFPVLKLKRTVRLTPLEYAGDLSSQSDPAKKCAGSMDAGDVPVLQPESIVEDTISGLRTFKITWKGLVSWRAPALGCREVQRRQNYATSTSNSDLVSYRIGEPPAILFQPAPEDVETSPTQMYKAWIAHSKIGYRENDPSMAAQLKRYEQLDEFYHSHRP